MKRTALFLALLTALYIFAAIPAAAAFENTYTNTGNARADIVGVAMTQLGYAEGSLGGGTLVRNNITKYGEWYGINPGAWCAMFVSWCANQAGIAKDVIPKYASCDAGMEYYKSAGRFEYSDYFGGSYCPIAGDIVFFGDDPTATWDSTHTAIVTGADGTYLYTVEGNSSDICKTMKYKLTSSYIFGYGVTYSAVQEAPPVAEASPEEALPPEAETAAENTAGVFSDVTQDTPCAAEIEALCRAGVVTGDGGGSYNPYSGVTRAQFVTMIARAAQEMGLYETPNSNAFVFADISAAAYYREYTVWAASLGITNGTGGGLFSPDAEITQEQAAVIAIRFADAAGLTTVPAGSGMSAVQAMGCSGYAAESVGRAVSAGMVYGSRAAAEKLSRAEAAFIAYALITH